MEKALQVPSRFAIQDFKLMARNNAFNFSRLSKYNYEYLVLEEVILLEYLIYHHVRKLEIPAQASRIEQETGLKKHRQQKALDLLSEKGFVEVEQLQHRKKLAFNAEKVALSSQRIFLKESKSVMRYLGQLIVIPATKKEKPQAPITKVKKTNVPKTASGKVALPANQTSLFD